MHDDMVMDWEKAGGGGDRRKYPTGTYKVEITGWQEVVSKTGTPQIRWFATIVIPDEFKGGTMIDHTPLTDKALWKLATLVKGCGVDLAGLPKMGIGSDAFKKVLDTCVHRQSFWDVKLDEQYNNNKVEAYMPVPDVDAIKPDIEGEDADCPF